MDNPYKLGKDCVYTVYQDEVKYSKASWVNVAGMSVDVHYPGRKLILCSICLGAASHANVGFRFVDHDGKPFPPMRQKTNTREPVHFSYEPPTQSAEDLAVVTFHLIADVEKKVQLQVRVDDSATICINSIDDQRDRPYNHMTISTLTVISL